MDVDTVHDCHVVRDSSRLLRDKAENDIEMSDRRVRTIVYRPELGVRIGQTH